MAPGGDGGEDAQPNETEWTTEQWADLCRHWVEYGERLADDQQQLSLENNRWKRQILGHQHEIRELKDEIEKLTGNTSGKQAAFMRSNIA